MSPGRIPEKAAKQVTYFTNEMIKVRDSMAFLKDSHPEMWTYLNTLARVPVVKPKEAPKPADVAAGAPAPAVPPAARAANAAAARRGRGGASDLPFMQSVVDAGVWVDGHDADLTELDMRIRVSREI